MAEAPRIDAGVNDDSRVLRPDRRQLELPPVGPEDPPPPGCRARIVWVFVEALDLGPL
jgi:hypothetical protein